MPRLSSVSVLSCLYEQADSSAGGFVLPVCHVIYNTPKSVLWRFAQMSSFFFVRVKAQRCLEKGQTASYLLQRHDAITARTAGQQGALGSRLRARLG